MTKYEYMTMILMIYTNVANQTALVAVLRPIYSDATQLDVELSCVGEVSIATRRRNSTSS